jgi:hypothetical protein
MFAQKFSGKNSILYGICIKGNLYTWLGDTLLATQYPKLYNITKNKHVLVADVLSHAPLDIRFNWTLVVMRVNSINVLDEGLRIGGRGRRMNSKVEVSQTSRDYVCIENKRGTQLAQSQSVPGWPLLAPICRWPGLKDPVGFNTNYSVRIRYQLVFRLCL